MEDGGITVVFIKSDRLKKKIPVVGQTVRLTGRNGLFTILSVDQKRRTAGVIRSSGFDEIDHAVPFSEIREVSNQLLKAIKEFLNTQEDDSVRGG